MRDLFGRLGLMLLAVLCLAVFTATADAGIFRKRCRGSASASAGSCSSGSCQPQQATYYNAAPRTYYNASGHHLGSTPMVFPVAYPQSFQLGGGCANGQCPVPTRVR